MLRDGVLKRWLLILTAGLSLAHPIAGPAAAQTTPAVSDGPSASPSASPAPSGPSTSAPSTSTPASANDLTVSKPVGRLMLTNADQINLLNMLANIDLSVWPALLKRNRSILNDEFIEVMGARSRDAMRSAVAAYETLKQAEARCAQLASSKDSDLIARANDERRKAETARNNFVEISFRYALLADLAASEIRRPAVWRLQLAEQYSQSKNGVPMALAVVGNVLVTEPNNVQARLLAGRLREATGDMYGAMIDYQFVVAKEPNNALAWTAIAKAHLLVSDLVKAKEALRRAVACTSGGSTDEAKALLYRLEHPQQLPPPSDPSMMPGGTPSATDSADAIVEKSDALLLQGRLEEARQGFQEAVRMQPTNARAHQGVGDIWLRSGDYLKAVEEYNLAVRYAPSNPVPLRYLALACEKVYDTTKNPSYLDRAIECLASAIRIRADYAEAREDRLRMIEKKVAEGERR